MKCILYVVFWDFPPQRAAAWASYTAQGSVASVGHIPHLVPKSPTVAEIARGTLIKKHNNCVSTCRGWPETTPLLILYGFGFASPFFPLLFPFLFCPYCLSGTAYSRPPNQLRPSTDTAVRQTWQAPPDGLHAVLDSWILDLLPVYWSNLDRCQQFHRRKLHKNDPKEEYLHVPTISLLKATAVSRTTISSSLDKTGKKRLTLTKSAFSLL